MTIQPLTHTPRAHMRTAGGAPGVDIEATPPNDRYQSFSGTSMAMPNAGGATMLMMMTAASAGHQLNSDQMRMLMASENPYEAAKNPPDEKAALRFRAKEVLSYAADREQTAQQVLDRFAPVQDEMPLIFDGDAGRDEYFQSRVDRRAELAGVLQQLEGEPGFEGRRSDWSSEKHVEIARLDPGEKERFYAELDNKNQAYYRSVITALTGDTRQ